jgi:hypothetical protein
MLKTELRIQDVAAEISAQLDYLFSDTIAIDLDRGILIAHSPEERYWIGGSHIIAIDLNRGLDELTLWLEGVERNGALQICDDISGCKFCTYGPGEEEGRAPSTNQDSVPAFITHIA